MKRRSETSSPPVLIQVLVIGVLLSQSPIACTTSFDGGPVPVGVLNVRSFSGEQGDVEHLPEVGERQPISLVSPAGIVRCSLTVKTLN